MEKQTSYIQIEIAPADIHLADVNKTRPYIYVAADESGRCLAIESHATQSPQQTTDFINRVISEMEIQ